MVGLSIVLESHQGGSVGVDTKNPQVINKATMNINHKPSPSLQLRTPYSSSHAQRSGFLEQCFFCAQKLLPGKDIYMYKGDRAFCCVECRSKHMDEEETTLIMKGSNCASTAAIKPTFRASSSGASR